ncbi:adenosylcobinamide-GDP ribazoletransferase, partial [Desulfovibrio sp. OttesenSCG-928-M16]|nr:adenosylcobinamide-GDP ribazoletransferase [Desulfovibrio sp. OttesenSCG-928-M16]MDL2207596.1 adenosylcobinamide-GDP ribazoletransferase [Desulfovibrio sp. OttesenSCG-928-M16]
MALAFLTRLAPARLASSRALCASVPFFPLVGAVLGLVLVLPFYLGLLQGQALVQAWLYVLFSAWLTRALHLDGLADVLDALGSGRQGEEFFAILKDSRLGAFGAVGLALTIAGQVALAAACFERQDLAPLFFAPLFGRCLPLILAKCAPPHPGASLGLLLATQRNGALFCGQALALAAGLWLLGPAALGLCLLLGALAVLFLRRVALAQGGYNGDYLGCAIIAGEMAVLL